MIKAIVVDDEKNVRNLLKILLIQNCPDIQIEDECGDLPEAVKAIRKHKPDLVFLDIEMPGHSGLELLDFFEEEEVDFQIIFTTAYSQYAIQAFDLSAVGYLLKPIKPDKLKEAVERFKKLEKKRFFIEEVKHNLTQSEKKITLATKYQTYFIDLKDVLYIKGEGAYSEFVLSQGERIMVSKNLGHFEGILKPHQKFVRISKQHIVNLIYVEKILKKGGYQVVLKGDILLPVSAEKEHLLHQL